MSIFPAAITLSQNHFDLLAILQSTGFHDGGVNVHAFSIITLLYAALFTLISDSQIIFFILHLLTFAMSATIVTLFYRLLSPIFTQSLAILFALLLLFWPLFTAQSTEMYLEIPLLLTTLLAISAWMQNRIGYVLLWLVLACWVKESGIIIVGTLIILYAFSNTPLLIKIQRVLLLCLPAIGLLSITAYTSIHINPTHQQASSLWTCTNYNFQYNLMMLPDLLVLTTISLILLIVKFKSILLTLFHQKIEQLSYSDKLRLVSILLFICFLGLHFIVTPVLFEYCHILPRYYLQVAPFLVLIIILSIPQISSKIMSIILLSMMSLEGINYKGSLYPEDANTLASGNIFSLAERSLEYRDLATVQQQAMAFLERIPPDANVYFGLYEHYLNQHPAMTYVNATKNNRHYILNRFDQLPKTLLSKLSHCDYFLYNYPMLGGADIEALLRYIYQNDPTRSVSLVTTFQKNNYKILLYVVIKSPYSCAINA